MKWSISSSKTFFQCPKKWYLYTIFAKSRSDNPQRVEAYLLKHLTNMYSWRGRLVDQVITTFVVPRLNKGDQVEKSEVLSFAERLMKSQLDFAKARMYRNLTNKVTAYNYCALLELENDCSLDEKSIDKINNEIEESLVNLLNSQLFTKLVEKGSYFVAQRMLQFHFANMTIKCTPDLIVFFNDKPPLIIDWKVETAKYREHWLQLGIYGVALSRVNPHKDFPLDSHNILRDPTQIDLIEFQLLRNQEIEYTLTEEDIIDIEDYVYTSSLGMQQIVERGISPEQLIEILPKARSYWACYRCNFQKICWGRNINDSTEHL